MRIMAKLRIAWWPLAVLALLALAGCAGGGKEDASSREVVKPAKPVAIQTTGQTGAKPAAPDAGKKALDQAMQRRPGAKPGATTK